MSHHHDCIPPSPFTLKVASTLGLTTSSKEYHEMLNLCLYFQVSYPVFEEAGGTDMKEIEETSAELQPDASASGATLRPGGWQRWGDQHGPEWGGLGKK